MEFGGTNSLNSARLAELLGKILHRFAFAAHA
jgi:hypothetical protein